MTFQGTMYVVAKLGIARSKMMNKHRSLVVEELPILVSLLNMIFIWIYEESMGCDPYGRVRVSYIDVSGALPFGL